MPAMGMGALERLNPARVLGDMTLVAKLDEGGMASVYLAAVGRGSLARLVAVKLLRADMVEEDLHTRFLDEARVVIRLQHNNLVSVRTAGEIDGQLYIAMEVIEGRNLADLWDRCAEIGKAFPIPLAVYMVREVLRGLHYAHTFPGLSLVHRDVSPSNILIDWAGAVRLADFGLATSTVKDSMTLPGIVFGKIGYMSPEAAVRQVVDRRSDVYSCGVVLWELLTGRPLRNAQDLETSAVARFKATPPSRLSKRVDEDLDNVVMRALKTNRDDRWPSADAMMGALTRWLAVHSPETGQDDLAGFMQVLFGEFQAQERNEREALLRSVVHQPADLPSAHRTPLPGHAPVASSSASGLIESKKEDPRIGAPISDQVDEVSNADVLLEGTVIAERYRVLERIGRGGMGAVYRAQHVTVGRDVALKVLAREWSRNPAVARRFRGEARAASAAGHPNIIEVFDAGELADGRLYLVMEFVPGRNLYEIMRETGRFEPVRACQIMREVLRAIRAAHDVGVIHRDLKPDNVMVVDRGEGEVPSIKVLDFGISVTGERSPDEERLTMPGHAIGTPEYMAPEQARGHAATESFDLYSAGVIFYEMLAGSPPFYAANFVEVMARKTSERAQPLEERRPGLVDELYILIDQALEIDPGLRPASAAEMLFRIEGILRTYELAASQASALRVQSAEVSSEDAESTANQPRSGATFEAESMAGVGVQSRRRRFAKMAAGALAAAVVGFFLARPSLLNLAANKEANSAPTAANPASISEAGVVALPAKADAAPAPTRTKTTAQPTAAPSEKAPSHEPESEANEEESILAQVEADEAGAVDEPASAEGRRPGANCERNFARLDAAISNGANDSILPLVRELSGGRCFQTRAEKRTRVLALIRAYRELKRWDDCVRVGKTSWRDPEIGPDYELCKMRQEAGRND
jgi:serine/threonine protein kinase